MAARMRHFRWVLLAAIAALSGAGLLAYREVRRPDEEIVRAIVEDWIATTKRGGVPPHAR